MANESIIYSITNKLDGKIFIGSTTMSLSDKWRTHISRSSEYKMLINQKIVDDGIENFKIAQILCCSKNEMLKNKLMYIEKYKTNNPDYGYNAIKHAAYHKYDNEDTPSMDLPPNIYPVKDHKTGLTLGFKGVFSFNKVPYVRSCTDSKLLLNERLNIIKQWVKDIRDRKPGILEPRRNNGLPKNIYYHYNSRLKNKIPDGVLFGYKNFRKFFNAKVSMTAAIDAAIKFKEEYSDKNNLELL
jgi:hypothetical protein